MDKRFKITLAIFAVIALVLLWGEHKVHLLGALPWLILLACPFIHMFMHVSYRKYHYGDILACGETHPLQGEE